MSRPCLYSCLLKLVFLLSTPWTTESSVSVARLEVAIYQFENNLNYRFRSDCCLRPSEGCDSQCDLTFRLCFRPFDAEEREELEDKDETICEIGSMNVSRKDVEKKSGKESYLRKSMNILDRWPAENKSPLPVSTDLTLAPRSFSEAVNKYISIEALVCVQKSRPSAHAIQIKRGTGHRLLGTISHLAM
ncbi:hypothetical protein TSMEX_005539 [Taenia solium]|eukprot:TsM_000548600 transcript=TsM_000548600 gene=TsM_000548600